MRFLWVIPPPVAGVAVVAAGADVAPGVPKEKPDTALAGICPKPK